MTNEKYTFVTDLREKKAAARGAYHKRSGAKTKRCTLPSDHLSPAELKRRNGPVKTFNISTCIHSYEEFRELPTDLKQKYITTLADRFHVNLSHIAATMGASTTALRQHLYTCGIRLGKSGPRTPAPEWEDFAADLMNSKGEWLIDAKPKIEAYMSVDPVPDCGPDTDPEPLPYPEPEPEPTVRLEPVSVEAPLVPRPPVLPEKITLNLTGSPENLVDLLSVLTEPGETYSFEITFHK